MCSPTHFAKNAKWMGHPLFVPLWRIRGFRPIAEGTRDEWVPPLWRLAKYGGRGFECGKFLEDAVREFEGCGGDVFFEMRD